MIEALPVHRIGWGERPAGSPPRGTVLAIGKFDGLHRGHAALISRTKQLARRLACPSALCTFDPHPGLFFSKASDMFRLLDDEGRARLLARHGIDALVVLPFDERMANLPDGRFVQEILVERLAVRGVVVGYNFFYGRGRAGSADSLLKAGRLAGFDVDVVERVTADPLGRLAGVSSSGIRGALAVGEVRRAALMLGYEYSVVGDAAPSGPNDALPLGGLRIPLPPSSRLAHGFYAVRCLVAGRLGDGVALVCDRPSSGGPAIFLQPASDGFDRPAAPVRVTFVDWLRAEPLVPSSTHRAGITSEDHVAAKSALIALGQPGMAGLAS